ncbi:MAG: phosphoribosylaminoimidazolesuccinocarboxamide synthase [Planctomycetota bacterium]
MTAIGSPVSQVDVPGLTKVRSGKVREVFALDGHLLLVATDRISAFDCVLAEPIPLKGAVLTQISRFWFERLRGITRDHLVTADFARMPPVLQPYAAALAGRSALVERTEPLLAEFVVRGYLAGSGWKEYQNHRSICGVRLPAGLQEGERLPQPILTPTTKAHTGHDQNLTRLELGALVGEQLAQKCESVALGLYRRAHELALERGIILADTKLEFGLKDGELIWIDEAFTPDSSRFWPVASYRPGRSQPSLDKQIVRDYLVSTGWNQMPPAPPLPAAIIERTTQCYLDVYQRLTGSPLDF